MARATTKKTTERHPEVAIGAPRNETAIKPTTGPQGVTPEMKERIESTLSKHHETLRELAKR